MVDQDVRPQIRPDRHAPLLLPVAPMAGKHLADLQTPPLLFDHKTRRWRTPAARANAQDGNDLEIIRYPGRYERAMGIPAQVSRGHP